MTLDIQLTGRPPAVTSETIAQWQTLAEDVDAALSQGGEWGMDLLLTLIPEWCEAANDINAARQISVDMAMKGLRHEALQWHAERFDEVAKRLSTNRPGWDAWEAELVRRGVAVPRFDREVSDLYDRIIEDLQQTDLAGITLEERLCQLRRNMIGRGAIDERLVTLQAIRRLLPSDEIWDDMINPIRQQRAGAIAGEVTAAINAVDLVRLERLREETMGWGAEVLGQLGGVLDATRYWQKALECRSGLSTAAVAFMNEVEKLNGKPTGTPAYTAAMQAARVARDRYRQIRDAAREAIDTAGLVPAIRSHLAASGVVEAFRNVEAGIKASDDTFREHDAGGAHLKKFQSLEAKIRVHADAADSVLVGTFDEILARGQAWIAEFDGLTRKAKDLETKSGTPIPRSLLAELDRGQGNRDKVQKKIDRILTILFWTKVGIVVVILAVFIGMIVMLIVNR